MEITIYGWSTSDRAGVLTLGMCFHSSGTLSSRLWQLADGRWSGPVTPRLAGRPIFLLDLARADHAAVTWAAGYAGKAGIIASSGPLR
jgi:hypothetical protein